MSKVPQCTLLGIKFLQRWYQEIMGQAGWHIQGQDLCEFKASLSYIGSFRTTERLCLKNKTRKIYAQQLADIGTLCPVCYLSLSFKDKQFTDLLLLVDIILFQQFFMQPIWVFDTWNWVLHLNENDTTRKESHVGLLVTRCGVGIPGSCLTCWRAAGMVMIFWMALPSRSMQQSQSRIYMHKT